MSSIEEEKWELVNSVHHVRRLKIPEGHIYLIDDTLKNEHVFFVPDNSMDIRMHHITDSYKKGYEEGWDAAKRFMTVTEVAKPAFKE